MFHVKHPQTLVSKISKRVCAPRAFVQYSTQCEQFQYPISFSHYEMLKNPTTWYPPGSRVTPTLTGQPQFWWGDLLSGSAPSTI